MQSVNRCTLLGTLGADPELKYTPAGKPVCTLRMATNEKWKDSAGVLQERTEWHRITVWGNTAEACAKYLRKGKNAYVEGRIQTRTWDDKDGAKRYSTEIVADQVVFLSGASKSDSSHPGEQPAPPVDEVGGEVPF